MQVNEIYCIGSNKFGQAGAGKKYHNQSFTTFTRIIFPVFIKQVVCGSHHSGLLTLEGNVYMTGSNTNGALGCSTASINYSYSPILVENLNDVSKISSGHYHMCAISQGRLYSWGKGVDGQLGTGKVNNCAIPTLVDSFGDEVEDVSCGLNHTLVKTINQKCYAFGNGIYGQLGIGSNKNSVHPILVKIDKVSEIAAGENFSLFLKQKTVYGTGDNSTGQVSLDIKKKYVLQPMQIKISNVTAIRAGRFSAAVLQDKEVYVWGLKDNNQPRILQEVDDYIMDIQIGGNLIYCLTSEGQFYEWRSHDPSFENKMKHSELREKTVLGFSVGQTHSLILGDIIDTVPLPDKPLKVLESINEQFSKEKTQTQKQRSSKMEEDSVQSSAQSISSQHLSRTPSSIMRQPHNFLKGESKHDKIEISEFAKDKSLPIFHNNKKEKKQEVDVSQCIKKVDQIMDMLSKNNNLERTQSNISELSRKTTKSRLDKSLLLEGKENKVRQKNEKSNKQLIIQLREKQLKISELQEKLSRKQVQIQSQRQLINLLRKISCQNQIN